jgi:hypothetical protein
MLFSGLIIFIIDYHSFFPFCADALYGQKSRRIICLKLHKHAGQHAMLEHPKKSPPNNAP